MMSDEERGDELIEPAGAAWRRNGAVLLAGLGLVVLLVFGVLWWLPARVVISIDLGRVDVWLGDVMRDESKKGCEFCAERREGLDDDPGRRAGWSPIRRELQVVEGRFKMEDRLSDD